MLHTDIDAAWCRILSATTSISTLFVTAVIITKLKPNVTTAGVYEERRRRDGSKTLASEKKNPQLLN
jgi:hypothetical protein